MLSCRTHNLLVLLGRSVGHEQSAVARSAAQHCHWRWLGASLFVVLYSWLISMSVPYFSSLVGIVASSTYLVRRDGGTACTCGGQFRMHAQTQHGTSSDTLSGRKCYRKLTLLSATQKGSTASCFSEGGCGLIVGIPP